jgi:hypothetical protein
MQRRRPGSAVTDQPHSDPPEGGRQAPLPSEPTTSVEQAIQTGCGTLLALQASLASVEGAPGHHHQAKASLQAAIDLVRAAISDLRGSTGRDEESPLSLGFVWRRRAQEHAD